MSFDEYQHPRGDSGRFAQKEQSAPEAALSPSATVPTAANTRVTLLADGVPVSTRQPGDTTDLGGLSAGLDAADGRAWCLRAEAVNTDGTVGPTSVIPCARPGQVLVFEDSGDYFTVSDLDSAGRSLADPRLEWRHEERLTLLPEERADLELVREALQSSPGDGPYLVDAVLDYEDPTKLNVDVMCSENFLWDDAFSEDELDANLDIVEDVYREWFNAEVRVDDSWEHADVTLKVQTDTARATNLLILEDAYGPYAKYRNETDPGTFGSPYVGNEIRRRIDERAATGTD